ncbi:hypothetical protein [Vreelandella neptunia]|uniref:Uncharacterized protein n=1 Tax=Vreelandella neptunia TaxID=115551 RepID=A0ABZ0YS63_9GAMM|nr:hypothetical protein [Halomonas neptunia]MDN3561696.1 hypothetical protein [Halomonas neptunia]WQH14598.1 hypothetical protein SR894_08675 [Halomonas neptunia]
MTRQAYTQPKCPQCHYRKAASEFRDPATGEALPACKHCMRIAQRGGQRWTA